MIKWLLSLLRIPTCKKCGSLHIKHGDHWIGGWNIFLNQAVARSGTKCLSCGHNVWDCSDEEYEKKLPEWCKSLREMKNEKLHIL